ncbi:MAG: DUF503 domain-containing protein [Candidatus Aminicenantes bacterium]|nr:DUF503 domain-containing protein [Candidatus Aminicenantes bacterium]
MIIGYLYLEFYIPWSHSLKEKRKFLNSFKSRILHRYNVAVAEVDFQELWQRSGVGIVTISSHRESIEDTFERVIKEAERLDAELIKEEIEFF